MIKPIFPTSLHPQLLSNLKSMCIIHPTEIQSKSFQPIYDMHHCLLHSNTGSGKTLAYLIPILDKLLKNPLQSKLLYPRAQIIVLNKQLQSQALSVLASLMSNTGLSCSAFPMPIGIPSTFLKVPDVSVSTMTLFQHLKNPKKLKTHIQETEVVVWDEIDEMMAPKQGQRDVQMMLSLNRNRSTPMQMIYCGATVDKNGDPKSKNPRNLLERWIPSLKVIAPINAQEIPTHIKQEFVNVGKGSLEKWKTLNEIVKLELQEIRKQKEIGASKKWIIFCNSVASLNGLKGSMHNYFKDTEEMDIEYMDGDERYMTRRNILYRFQKSLKPLSLLISTNIVCRGLDLKDVYLVLNYDEPLNYTDYVHRVGRGARNLESGKALTLVSLPQETLREE